MKLLQETPKYLILEDFLNNQPIRVIQDKETGEILYHLDDVAKILDFKNGAEMMKNDEVLDIVNKHSKLTGDFPIKKIKDEHLDKH